MATSARIYVEVDRDEDTVYFDSTRVQWDGHLSGLGSSLVSYFDTQEDAEYLVKSGREIKKISGDRVKFYDDTYQESIEVPMDEYENNIYFAVVGNSGKSKEDFQYIWTNGKWHAFNRSKNELSIPKDKAVTEESFRTIKRMIEEAVENAISKN